MNFIRIITVTLLGFLSLSGAAQNLIGYNARQIIQIMKDKEKSMNFQKFTNNSTFKYLKYVDDNDSQTLLFFLTADSICKAVRLICDKNLKQQKIKEFNNIYKTNGVNVWTDKRNGKKYIIELKDEDVSLTINIKSK